MKNRYLVFQPVDGYIERLGGPLLDAGDGWNRELKTRHLVDEGVDGDAMRQGGT